MNGGTFNGNNLPHELLLTKRQATKLRNTIKKNISTDIKLSKAQISKIKIISVISNKDINDIIKIVQALEDSSILLKGVTKTIKNETKE